MPMLLAIAIVGAAMTTVVEYASAQSKTVWDGVYTE